VKLGLSLPKERIQFEDIFGQSAEKIIEPKGK
jgi:hypothetical protein